MALQLYDVRDAEAFVAAIANRSQLGVGPDDSEDLRQYLLTELWVLSPLRALAEVNFSAWAIATLRLRVIDWQRQRSVGGWKFSGRTTNGQSRDRQSRRRARADSMGATLASDGSDVAADWLAPSGGLLAERDRERVRDLELLGLGPDG